MMDLLIKNALIYDGSGGDPFVSDIGISGDTITHVGAASSCAAEKVIDASGLAVSPGFIDTHAHSDFTLLADPRAEGKLLQGVTTEINGNCGMSAAPLLDKAFERREEDLRELGISERWRTFGEYFSILSKKGLGLNTAFLAGHGNIRGSAAGYDDRELSEEDHQKMARLLASAVEEGAVGLSTGLIYPPGIYSTTEELARLASVLKPYDLIYASHMRSEGTALIEAIGETLEIGRKAGIRIQVSHLKTAGAANWHKADKAVEMLVEERAKGLLITCDRYPYTASATDLDALLPAWTYAGGNEEELKRLSNPSDAAKIISELREQAASDPDYWDKVIVSTVSGESGKLMEGKTISQIASESGAGPAETVIRILRDERLRVGAVFMSMSEQNLLKFLALPFCMIGSDSSARCYDGPTRQGKPHPRTFGTFPRFLGGCVRERKIMSLSEAVRRATGLPAETFGLKKRGIIAKGMFADIVIFDQESVTDTATFENPYGKPEGILYVFVNGIEAAREGTITNKPAGRILRHSS